MAHSRRFPILLAVLAVLGMAGRAWAIPLNEEGTINLNRPGFVGDPVT